MKKCTVPSNKNAQNCVKNVMKYLSDITYKQVLTGQHTQTTAQEELEFIEKNTGKLPALVGFELLSYSPNINYFDTDDECMTEVQENFGTLKNAWEWAKQGGLLTFTWHWFSPLGGKNKSFFTKFTDFDPEKAVIEGTTENKALISDMDTMAGILRPFCNKKIPILWRPIHEGEGDWFWWSSKGSEPLKKLWREMYYRFTEIHKLNNLIWVFNSPRAEDYPGDDVVDVISRDMYPPEHIHTSQKEMYDELVKITNQPKIVLIGETGTLPDVEKIVEEKVGWASFMTWSKGFCTSEKFTTKEFLQKTYNSEYAVTLDKLPKLY